MQYRLNMAVLERQLKAKGFSSLSALASKRAIHRNTLKAYITGEKSPIVSAVTRLAEALAVEPLELITTDSRQTRLLLAIEQQARVFLLASPSRALVMFGSRARGLAREFSDLDLGVTGGEDPISTPEFLQLKRSLDDVIEEAPLCVDVLNLDVAPQDFLLEVSQDLRYVAGDESKFHFLKGVIHGLTKTYQD